MIGMVIMVSAAKQAALQAAGQPIPTGQPVQALIDTGASHTCIDPMVFTALGLQPTGSVPMHTPSTGTTPMAADTYDITLVIPGPQGAIPFVRQNIQVSAADLFHAQGFHVLLGRDILSQLLMTYNGSAGFFVLAY